MNLVKGEKGKKVKGKEITRKTLLPSLFFFFYQNVAAVEAASFPACRMKVSPFFFFTKIIIKHDLVD